MLRRLVNWLLYKLHFKKLEAGDAYVDLSRLVGVLIAFAIMVTIMRSLGLDKGPRPWYKRLWYSIRHGIRALRAKVIGY